MCEGWLQTEGCSCRTNSDQSFATGDGFLRCRDFNRPNDWLVKRCFSYCLLSTIILAMLQRKYYFAFIRMFSLVADRSLRPLFPPGFNFETQVWNLHVVLSHISMIMYCTRFTLKCVILSTICCYCEQIVCNLLAVDGHNDPDIISINSGTLLQIDSLRELVTVALFE